MDELIELKLALTTRWGINREGFNFKLAMVKKYSTLPLMPFRVSGDGGSYLFKEVKWNKF